MRKLSFLLLFVAFTGLVQAQTPLDKKWAEAETYYNAGTFGSFAGEANVTIRYAAFPRANADKAIVLIPGYSESYLKYKEFIYDLGQRGFSVYTMDHRGQGLSQRLVANPSMIHLDKFEYMPKDVETFIRNIVQKEHKGRVFIYAHSMGGLIASYVLANNNVKIEAAILNAPLFAMNLWPMPVGIARRITGIQVYRGKNAQYAPGMKDYDAAKRTNFSEHNTSRSKPRFEKLVEQYEKHPELRVGGPSNGWVNTMIHGCEDFRAMAKTVRTPVLLLQAGDDKLVSNSAQDKVCKLMKNCTKVAYPGARHELWREHDVVREDVLKRVSSFFK